MCGGIMPLEWTAAELKMRQMAAASIEAKRQKIAAEEDAVQPPQEDSEDEKRRKKHEEWRKELDDRIEAAIEAEPHITKLRIFNKLHESNH